MTNEPSAAARPALAADTLYLGDNGRAFCGTLAHAGMTAFYSGRDLSGQPVEALIGDELAEMMALAAEVGRASVCEGCATEHRAGAR